MQTIRMKRQQTRCCCMFHLNRERRREPFGVFSERERESISLVALALYIYSLPPRLDGRAYATFDWLSISQQPAASRLSIYIYTLASSPFRLPPPPIHLSALMHIIIFQFLFSPFAQRFLLPCARMNFSSLFFSRCCFAVCSLAR